MGVVATLDGRQAILGRRALLVDSGVDVGPGDEEGASQVWLAFGLSGALLSLAAGGVLDPLRGALAQSVAVLVVVANSARILRFDNGDKPVAAVVATPGSDTESGAGAPVPGDPDQAEAALVPRPPEKVDAAVS